MARGMRRNLLVGALIGIALAVTPPVTAADRPQVVVALDLSGSMRGDRLVSAQNALLELAKESNPSLEIGMVTFSGVAKVVLQPTLDRSALRSVISQLTADGKTALYDGMGLALATVTSSNSMVVVVCDGEDNVSAGTFNDVLTAALARNIPISSIAVKPSAVQRQILQSLSAKTGGQLVAADDLSSLLKLLPKQFVQPTASPTASNDVLQVNQVPTQDEERTALLVVVTVSLIALLLVTSFVARDVSRKRRAVLETVGLSSPQEKVIRNGILDRIWETVDRKVLVLRRLLEDVGISLTVREWLTRQLAFFVASYLTFLLLMRELLPTLIMALLSTLFIVSRNINRSRTKIVRAFEEELHSALLVAASSLRAGLSFPQALENLSKEAQGEVPRQLRRALAEVQIGSTLEDALLRVADRVRSQDLRWVVAALAIQREVGGSLSTVLVSTSEMIQNRFALAREVRALSAEGRSSAQVLVALPIFLFLYFYVTSRQYLSAFWSGPSGFLMLGVIVTLEFLGWTWIRKVVEVKV